MSEKVTISVELTADRFERRAGDLVEGIVTVDVTEDVVCRGLDWTERVSVYGQGNSREIVLQTSFLFEGDWEAGATYEYPIQVTLSPGPSTYEGTSIHIERLISASADLSWTEHPSGAAHVRFKKTAPDQFGPEHQEGFDDDSGKGNFASALMVLVFATPLLLIPLQFNRYGYVDACSLITVLFFFALSGMVLWQSFRSRLAELVLGDVTVEIPSSLSAGTCAEALVHFVPRLTSTISKLMVTLIGEEVTVNGGGSKKHTKTHRFFEQVLVDERDLKLRRGEERVFGGAAEIPEGAAASYAIQDNHVRWCIQIHCDISWFPDWLGTYVLAVA